MPESAPWNAWVWNDRIRMWVRIDEGSEEDMGKLLAVQQSAGAKFAMSRQGDSLPEPPRDLPLRTGRDGG